MFTGLVEEIGEIQSVNRRGETLVLCIKAKRVIKNLKRGDSLAVNGVCLTVIAFKEDSLTADVMPQTFRFTNLKQLYSGAFVNLERAMAFNSRFGGHLVQGHIDGVGQIKERIKNKNAMQFTIESRDLQRISQIVPQGSITVDGTSLTVAKTTKDTFTVAIIPHTFHSTILKYKVPGDLVNIECDILAKYMERTLQATLTRDSKKPVKKGISLSFLAENGFL